MTFWQVTLLQSRDKERDWQMVKKTERLRYQ
jgi:hypothetical protein